MSVISAKEAIKLYCNPCRRGLPFSVCASPACGIYKYLISRAKPHHSGIINDGDAFI